MVENDQLIGRDLMMKLSERKSIYEEKNNANASKLRASNKAFDDEIQNEIFEERFKKQKLSLM